LRPRRDCDVCNASSNSIEQLFVAHADQIDSRLPDRRGERVEQPARSVKESDGNFYPGRFSTANPLSGQQRTLYLSLDSDCTFCEVFSGCRQPQCSPARFGEKYASSPFRFCQSVARRGWAEMKRTSRVAKAPKLT
jgi:hypothetical protein